MPIPAYLQQCLVGRLATYALTDRQIALVVDDVHDRLTSLLSYWNDLPVRQALLFCGREEATFYEPTDIDLDVRCLVVVAIRNSLIENLASTPDAAQSLGLVDQVLVDRDIPAITSAAIRHFGGVDLAGVARTLANARTRESIFACLPLRYPTAWQAMSQLTLLASSEAHYEPVHVTPSVISMGRPLPQSWHPGFRPNQVVSGVERSIEPQLQRVLRLVKNGVVPALFSDSFKMITRNPGKLFEVIEFVLSNNRAVVTHNYYLKNGHVAQRIPLLRPAHTVQQAREKFQDHSGLCDLHDLALREIGAFL